MLVCHCCLLFFVLIKSCRSTTSIKSYPTVELRENIGINSSVIRLWINEEKSMEMKRLKLILLNLSGFETNLFEIRNENVFTINEIDREEFVDEKRCFDRLYCLIELHILVNDGQEYWVIPIHIVDENDNKPELKNSSIEIKYLLNNEINEYKIPFEGGIDRDEGINSNISYLLDCSIEKRNEWKMKNEKTLNCFPLFDLIIFSQSLINQYDQLGLKFNPSFLSLLENEYEFILYAFNLNRNKEKELINSMIIKVKVEKLLEKPRFVLSEYRLIIKESFLLEKGKRIGQVFAKSNDLREKILYKLINKTNEIEINSITGELYFSINYFQRNEIKLIVEASYLINSQIKSFVPVFIFIRLLNKLNKNLLINYQIKSLLIKQINNLNEFYLHQSNWIKNEILFILSIKSFDYPFDQFHLSLYNSSSFFQLLSSIKRQNEYFLQIQSNSFQSNFEYFLRIQIKHYLTNEYLDNLIIKLIFYSNEIKNFSLEILCLENETFNLYNKNKKELISKIKVMETNINIYSFQSFVISKENEKKIIIDQCPMRMMENKNFNQSTYQLCSLLNQCFNISLDQKYSKKILILKRLMKIRPIEIIIFIILFLFLLLTITIILIICRLRAFHFCLSMKNYLFYGKKYRINQAQRLSSTKITKRIHSIVVQESQSPSIDQIKSLEPYIFNINQYIEQEKIPSINLYRQTSSSQIFSISESRQSSLDQGERNLSNDDEEMNRQISRSSSLLEVMDKTNQLLEMIPSNEDFSQLASEV